MDARGHLALAVDVRCAPSSIHDARRYHMLVYKLRIDDATDFDYLSALTSQLVATLKNANLLTHVYAPAQSLDEVWRAAVGEQSIRRLAAALMGACALTCPR